MSTVITGHQTWSRLRKLNVFYAVISTSQPFLPTSASKLKVTCWYYQSIFYIYIHAALWCRAIKERTAATLVDGDGPRTVEFTLKKRIWILLIVIHSNTQWMSMLILSIGPETEDQDKLRTYLDLDFHPDNQYPRVYLFFFFIPLSAVNPCVCICAKIFSQAESLTSVLAQ